jgi:hypothetical protein
MSRIGLGLVVVFASSCGSEEGPVTARIGAASFSEESSASYFAGTKFFGFSAAREDDDTRIEIRVEGLEATGTGTFAAGPNEEHEISLTLNGKSQSTRSTGLGSIEISEFLLRIDHDLGVGEGRVRGAFEATFDGVSISDGRFDVPVFSSDICNADVEARDDFDCD